MNTRIAFSTTAYEFAHGRKPRGEGRWAFEFLAIRALPRGGVGMVWGAPVFFSGTFAVAKREAMAHARALGGVMEVRVGS